MRTFPQRRIDTYLTKGWADSRNDRQNPALRH